MRRISAGEVMGILRRFPEMVPDYLASAWDDTALLARLFRFSEVTAPPLERFFPAVRFYKGLDGKKPPHPYMMAVAGDRRELLPGGFNLLLLDCGLQVTSDNILALAEVFVLLALGSGPALGSPELWQGRPGEDELLAFPPVTFLGGKRTREPADPMTCNARLKVAVRGQEEEWHFPSLRGHFNMVTRGNASGVLQLYTLADAEHPHGD